MAGVASLFGAFGEKPKEIARSVVTPPALKPLLEEDNNKRKTNRRPKPRGLAQTILSQKTDGFG